MLSSFTSTPQAAESASHFPIFLLKNIKVNPAVQIFAGAVLLVSVPVFFQAPLVRAWPLFSLALSVGWLGLGRWLQMRPQSSIWGDLLLGFAGSWFAGSIFWGWWRWEPLLHLPIEAICVPVALWCLFRRQFLIGSWFYLGSLFGTLVTDVYFYLVDLIPAWRQLMQVDPSLAPSIFQNALLQMQTPWGISCAGVLLLLLLSVGLLALRSKSLHGWAFSGAVLSTILVDSLFWIAASLA